MVSDTSRAGPLGSLRIEAVPQLRSGWIPFVLSVFVGLVVLVFLSRETWGYLFRVNHMGTGEYSSAWLIAVICVLLLIHLRHDLAKISPKQSWLGVVCLAALSILWAASVVVDVRTLETVTAILMLHSLCWALLGNRIAFVLTGLFGCLLLVAPIWEPVIPRLQIFAETTSLWTLKLVGISAHLEGHVISIPVGNFHIAEGCSGVRYVLAAIPIGILNVHLNRYRFWTGLGFILLLVAIAMMANVGRIVGVIMAGAVTDMHHPWLNDHSFLGWTIFGAVLIPLLIVGRLFGRDHETAGGVRVVEPRVPRYYPLVLVCAFAGMISGPFLLWSSPVSDHYDDTFELSPPLGTGRWLGPLSSGAKWRPHFQGADAELRAVYRDDHGRSVDVYVAGYRSQRDGKEVVNVYNEIFDKETWYVSIGAGGSYIRTGTWPEVVREIPLQASDGRKRLLWHWYEVGGRVAARPGMAKLYQLLAFFQQDRRAAAIVVATDYRVSPEAAREVLVDFSRVLGSSLRVNALIDQGEVPVVMARHLHYNRLAKVSGRSVSLSP